MPAQLRRHDRRNALLAKDARKRQLIDCAVWPDDIKQGERNSAPFKAPINRPWHYVNLPYDAPAARLDPILNRPGVTVSPRKSSSANVVTALRYYVAFLKSGAGTPTEQADALSWVCHLVGDVHQPLHTLTVNNPLPNYTPPLDARGKPADAGGNGFLLTHASAGNLHAYWDDLLDPGQPAGSNSDLNARLVAATVNKRPNKPTPAALADSDPAHWALESYSTRQFVYSPPLAPRHSPALKNPTTPSPPPTPNKPAPSPKRESCWRGGGWGGC